MIEHDAPRLALTRADMHSQLDEIAKRVVAAGGGTQAVTDATDLRTLKQVAHLIDPAVLIRAFDNDALEPPQPPLALKPWPQPLLRPNGSQAAAPTHPPTATPAALSDRSFDLRLNAPRTHQPREKRPDTFPTPSPPQTLIPPRGRAAAVTKNVVWLPADM
jgi:hypothetical protein